LKRFRRGNQHRGVWRKKRHQKMLFNQPLYKIFTRHFNII
jgi:hypothetical protein